MRSLLSAVAELGESKFVLLSGPRQVGKTTLAHSWLGEEKELYLNWDVPEDRDRILRGIPPGTTHLVLDEFHKYPPWKSYLKGLYDRRGFRPQVLVTGSARLDVFRKRGESLLGRYEYLRLHPFSVGEVVHGTLLPPVEWLTAESRTVDDATWQRLLRYGGFPESYTRADDRFRTRWSILRRSAIICEDLRDLTQIRSLALIERLALLLPSRVGFLLSLNSLREELEVAHDTVRSWIEALERVYYCFRISPYHRRVSRGLKKEQKLYLWDWSEVEEPSARFENLVASHLLKAVHLWTDLGFGEFGLSYVRDREGYEVDFVVTERNRPAALIECTLSDETPAKALSRFGESLGGIPQLQLVATKDVDRRYARGRVVSASAFLAALP